MSFGARSPVRRNTGQMSSNPVDRQVLAVVAVRVAVEAAGHPAQPILPPDTRTSCVHTFAVVASLSGASSV